ncbi:thermonuclease family protein [Sporosarcina sp. Marseille-Q4063]|uniref:thermonuclease family protein n=1 Tax=Sporosarcina sp. Marseille-Q4063 TaxID=2810514 RepID=UPI0020163E13|nr:thermonuclease family protein [Sporosarcina sp. Marseille-Q4063]
MTNNGQRQGTTKWKGWSGFATIIALIVAALFMYFSLDEEPDIDRTGFIPVELVRTIDGDTIKIRYDGKEQNLRYLLIDTPELNHKQQGKQPFAEESAKRNDELLKSGKLEIEFDIGGREDKYGRLLAYVYIDGESVQQKLVEEGLARVAYIYPPNTKHLDPYKDAEKKAQQAGIGIWSIEDYVTNRGFNN